MSRLASYLGVLSAVAFFIVLMALAGNGRPLRAPEASSIASSTTSSFPAIVLPPLAVPDMGLGGAPSAEATSSLSATPKKIPAPASQPAPEPAPVAAVPVLPASSPDNSAALDAAALALRGAAVNIICYVPPGVGLHSISGSGIFIDSKGIILTNAHVAQYFLLEDKGARCTIRTGSPATDSYEAALIYISPEWLRANEKVLTQTLPNGTGEYDFAFLAVTKSVTRNVLPAAFPFVPLATQPVLSGTPVVIATYGAQFLESSQIQSSLFPTIVFGSVKEIFTFAVNTIDVLALGGSAAAQEGSSGGGVADATGKLVGTITTSTVTGATDTRKVSAITASYIRAEYANETGSALDLLLEKPTAASIAEFAPRIPELEAIITVGLP